MKMWLLRLQGRQRSDVCVVRIALKNRSFESEEDLAEDLMAICPDSKIPPKMQLRRSKITYLLVDALFPYLRDVVLIDVKSSDYYSMQLDEANKGNKYLGIVLRYLQDLDVKVVCIDLPMLSSTTAEDMAAAVMETITECGLNKEKCLSLMTDNCNAMRGGKSGLTTRLRQDLPNVVDLGGCTLHHIHNAARYACEAASLGVRVETLVRNVYCHFKFSLNERDRLHSIAMEFDEIKKLAFLRPVETRWLQLLPVVQRVLRMYQPIVRFFSDSKTKANGANFSAIKADVRDPKVEFFLLFLAEVLQPLQQFEMLFQQQGCQIHHLYSQLVNVTKRWLLRFVKPEKLPKKKLSKLDIADESIWLPPYEISMGEPAKRHFVDMTGENQQECLVSVKAFFRTGTAKLFDYLPLNNSILCACQLLDPKKQGSKDFVQWASTLAKHLPVVVPDTEIGNLETEARLHQLHLKETPGTGTAMDMTVTDFWSYIAADTDRCRPLLLRLVRALLVLPHGNADVERVFSSLSDAVTKKRCSLAPQTVKAILVAHSCLQVKQWSAATIPIVPQLQNMCASACAAYRQRLQDEKIAAERERTQQLEASVVTELQAEKKASKVYTHLDKSLEQVELDIQQKQKEREDSHKLLHELTAATKSKDAEIEKLRRQQQNVQKKKQKEAEKLAELVLKRKAAELLSTSSITSTSSRLPADIANKKFRGDTAVT